MIEWQRATAAFQRKRQQLIGQNLVLQTITDVILLLVLCYFNMPYCSVPDHSISPIPELALCSCSYQIPNTVAALLHKA